MDRKIFMRAGLLAGLAAGLALDLSPVLRPDRAHGAERIPAESLSCQFLSKDGYYKFSRFKAAGKRSWPFALTIDDRSRKVMFSANGSTSSEPFFVVGDDIRFNVGLENANEYFTLNLKSLQFSSIADTRRYRIRHTGVCQAQSA
jgi:hypothetical protein